MKIERLILINVIVFISLSLQAQVDSTDYYAVSDTLEDFGLFTREDPLEMSLQFDITQYLRKKSTEDYLEAVLTYHISKTDSINKMIKLRSRGEFRNGYCAFPPLVLNFKKTDFQLSELDNLEKMKVVTHCRSGNESNLFKEYLIYKLYNVLSDTSFRVRLVKISYINTAKETKPIRTYAFFIEPLNLLAERIGVVPIDVTTLTQKSIYRGIMDRVAIFNYMIGNTDWSVPNQHNIKVLVTTQPNRPNLGIAVPYDFDYSGLVNASYAIPAEGLAIESVRERIYQGVCRNEEEFMSALKEFESKKDSFYRVILDFPYLNERSKKDMIKYLDGFYSCFDKRNTIIQYFNKDCKRF